METRSRQRSARSPVRWDALHPGMVEGGTPGTRHPPRVMLGWDPGEQGPNPLCLCQEIAGTGKRLNFKKKKKFYFKIFLFFFFVVVVVVFNWYFKKSGVKVQKKSVAERQRFRNHSAELTQAIDTEHNPNTPTTRRGQSAASSPWLWIITTSGFLGFFFVFLCTKHTKACHGARRKKKTNQIWGGRREVGTAGAGRARLPLSPRASSRLTSGCSADS